MMDHAIFCVWQSCGIGNSVSIEQVNFRGDDAIIKIEVTTRLIQSQHHDE